MLQACQPAITACRFTDGKRSSALDRLLGDEARLRLLRVLSRERLLERVWGYEHFVETRSVDVHVGRLRAKLGVAGQQIETVVGLGYRFSE